MQTYEREFADIQVKLHEAYLALSSCIAQVEVLKKQIDAENSTQKRSKSKAAIEVKAPEPQPEPVVNEPLVINDEWKAVLESLEHGKENIFVTGGAGTGKSTLLNHFVETYPGSVAILAPTGVAALRVGGETIHRFFGFPAHALDKDDIQEVSDSRRAKYKAVDLLLIDEISMVRADVMDAIDRFMRLNGRDKTRSFGGCRLIMIGDLFQLPPVAREKDEKKWLSQRYGTETPFFFHAEVWRDAPLKICELTTIFRQKDPAFTDALNAIRRGSMTPDHVRLINTRVKPTFKPAGNDVWLTLTTTNASADETNQKMLKGLPTPSTFFEAQITGDFDLKNAPTDEKLEIKEGAAVMFIRNKAGQWVNGTLGKVVKVAPLTVEANGVEHEVESETWENLTYEFDEKTRKLKKTVKGKFVQIPLKLAAAITIHKSQGLTFDRCIVDFANGAFAAGQAYTGLSRCRTLEGMVLRRPLRESDLITSTEAQKFMSGKQIARPAPAPAQMNLIEPVATPESDLSTFKKLKDSHMLLDELDAAVNIGEK